MLLNFRMLWWFWIINLSGAVTHKKDKVCEDAEVKDVTELVGCERIRGDLIVDGAVSLGHTPTTVKIKAVSGCIVIKDSYLTNLDWLDLNEDAVGTKDCRFSKYYHNFFLSEESGVRGNRQLCVTPRIRRILKAGYDAIITDDLPEECHSTCEDIDRNYEKNLNQEIECRNLTGNIYLHDVKGDQKLISSLEKLEYVNEGRIRVMNSNYKTIDFFPNLLSADLLISNNSNLETIDLPKLSTTMRCNVNGNVKLSQETIDKLNNWCSKHPAIQPYGECGGGTITDIRQLKKCRSVHGDLWITGVSDPDFPLNISEMGGDIYIFETNLTHLDWIPATARIKEITRNPKLCVTPRMRKTAPVVIDGNLPENCHWECDSAYFHEMFDRIVYEEMECRIINGDLRLIDVEDLGNPMYRRSPPRTKNFTQIPSRFKKIQEVRNGSITIDNVNYSKIDFLSNLTKITPRENEPDIIIRNNANLETIVLPALSRKPKIVVRGNRKLSQKTLDELKNWAAEGSEIQEQGECGFSSTIGVTDESQLKGCSLIGSELKLQTEITAKQISHKIGHVDGCIKIQFTKLESLDFLRFDRRDGPYCNINSVIENNINLCLVPREERLLKELYKAWISGNNQICDHQKRCKDGTSFKKIMEDEIECTEFVGTLMLTGPYVWQNSVRSIRKITGKVVLDGTILNNLDMFSGLKELNLSNSDDYAFEIINNANLTDLKFSPNLPKMKIKVRGNKLLSQKSIDYLKLPATSASGSDIQEFGDCPYVNSTSDLAGCKSVYKDLNLISTPIANVNESLRTVGGCIRIKDTLLTNLNFLKLEDTSNVNCPRGSEISNNKNLCILPQQKKVLETAYKATIKDYANEDCATVCDATTLEKDFNVIVRNQQVCKTLKGKLVIENYAVSPPWFSLLKTVETVDGGNIVIRNNELLDLDIFPNLKGIRNYTETDPAIVFTNNTNLNSFALPSLRVIDKPNAQFCLRFKENNPSFDSRDLFYAVNNVEGCRSIDHDVEFSSVNSEGKNDTNILDLLL